MIGFSWFLEKEFTENSKFSESLKVFIPLFFNLWSFSWPSKGILKLSWGHSYPYLLCCLVSVFWESLSASLFLICSTCEWNHRNSPSQVLWNGIDWSLPCWSDAGRFCKFQISSDCWDTIGGVSTSVDTVALFWRDRYLSLCNYFLKLNAVLQCSTWKFTDSNSDQALFIFLILMWRCSFS